jgi:hypothetical protein
MHLERLHLHWPVHWSMLYGNEEFVANGTVLDITSTGYRVAGPVPVYPGMRLNIWVWPPDKPEGLHMGDVTILGVNGYAFGLYVENMYPMGHKWMTQFLDQALWCWFTPRAA